MKDLLVNLINLKSTKDHADLGKECLELIAKYVEARVKVSIEWHEKEGRHSLVIHNDEPGEKKFNLILSGHVDVVPGPEASFIAKESEGKIWGRGTSDMKGVDVAMIEAFVRAVEANLNKKIAIMLTSDEEIGGFNGTGYLVGELGYTADFVFLPDSGQGDWNICTDEKGIVWLRLTATGKAAHGSRPWLGENAADKLLDGYCAVREEFERLFGKAQGEDDYRPTMNLGVITAGQTPNIIPEEASMRLDIRFPGDYKKEDITEPLRKVAERCDLNATEELYGPANSTPADHPQMQRWVELVEKRRARPTFYKSAGASDARFFSEKGMPVLMTKPVCSEIHVDEEWVDLKSLEEFTDVLTEWIKGI